jgi:uncharacterized FlaG/YvyC family protein
MIPIIPLIVQLLSLENKNSEYIMSVSYSSKEVIESVDSGKEVIGDIPPDHILDMLNMLYADIPILTIVPATSNDIKK